MTDENKDTEGDSPPKLGRLITPDDPPPGCHVMELPVHGGPSRAVIARDTTGDRSEIATDLAHTHREMGNCTSTVRVLRYPTTGLNLPGEDRPVGVLVWCHHHGEVGATLDRQATQQERIWGWHTSTIV
jgi:hypothetical protein